MSQSKWAGVVWLVAALVGVVVTVIFRTDQLQWLVTIVGSVAAAVVGVFLVWRSMRDIVMWSGVVTAAWLVMYVWLTYSQRAELAAWTTDVFVGALGAVAGASALTRSLRRA